MRKLKDLRSYDSEYLAWVWVDGKPSLVHSSGVLLGRKDLALTSSRYDECPALAVDLFPEFESYKILEKIFSHGVQRP